MAVNDDIADKLTGRDVVLQRFFKGAARRVLDTLKASEARIVERLLDASEGMSRTRQEKLLKDIRAIIATGHKDALGVLTVDIAGLAEIESEFVAGTIADEIPVAFQTVTPAPAQVIAATNARPFQGKLLADVYRELPEASFRKIRDTIRLGFLEGQTTPEIIRALRGTAVQGYKNGVFNRARRDMEAVTRTALAHTANTARNEVYKANEGVIKGVQWTSTLDGKTSAICQARDGEIYPPDEGPRPPAHFNCRSATVPITKSWKELGYDIGEVDEGTRASMNGQVPADQNYDAWLRKQPAAFQDEVLGKGKADLFRDGMNVKKFVDKSGRELSLDELRKMAPVKATPTPTPKPKPKPKPKPEDVWAGKGSVEAEFVKPAFENARPERLRYIQRAANLKEVRSGKGSHFQSSTNTIQMSSKHSGEDYKAVMRHEYAHFIDNDMNVKALEARGLGDKLGLRYVLGPSRLAKKELGEDAKILFATVSKPFHNVWSNKKVPVNRAFSDKVEKDRFEIRSRYRKADRVGNGVSEVNSDFEKRGLDQQEVRDIFPHMFTGSKTGKDLYSDAADFFAAFDNGDHVRLVYDGGASITHKSPLSGLSDSIGASTNQSLGYRFGHPASYYSQSRSHDRRTVDFYGDVGIGGLMPSKDKFPYGTGNTGQLWANWFEAYTSGNDTQYTVFKKFFPQTSARFEGILEGYADGKFE